MNTLLYLGYPVLLLALAGAWIAALVDALRRHRPWIWVVTVLLLGPLGALFYLLNFRIAGNGRRGWVEHRFGGRAQLRRLAREAADKDLPVLWRDLGDHHLRFDEFPQAVTALKRALELAPEDLRSQFLAGVALLHAGKPELALAHLEYVEDHDPRYAWGDLLVKKARAQAAAGNEDAAFDTLARLDREFNRPEGVVCFARMLVRRGQHDKAREALRRVLDHAGEVDPVLRAEHEQWLREARRELRRLDSTR
jgi:tetratricopeptide (TPR) repeat protein